MRKTFKKHVLLERKIYEIKISKTKNKKKKKKKACCRGIFLLSSEKRACYIILTMCCYPKDGLLRNPNFTRHKLYHSKMYQYLQHSHLVGCIEYQYNRKVVLRIRLTRVQSQDPIKQVGLIIHSKTFLVRNSDTI